MSIEQAVLISDLKGNWDVKYSSLSCKSLTKVLPLTCIVQAIFIKIRK